MNPSDPEVLANVLEAIDAEAPPAVEVAERLADATDVSVSAAQDAVYGAIDDGTLVEADTGGFGGVRLAEDVAGTAETAESDESDPEDTEKATPTPRGEAAEPGEEYLPESLPSGGEGLEDRIAERSGEWFHPPAVAARDWWVTWILDGVGRKRPVAPWQNGHA